MKLIAILALCLMPLAPIAVTEPQTQTFCGSCGGGSGGGGSW